MSKALIIFYSLEGNTQFIAERIASKIWADLLQLHPEKEINQKWFMKYMRWGRQVVMKFTPKLQPRTIDINQYDTLIFWTPVWAFNYAPALRTFFTEQKFQNKKILLFCCHEGGKGKSLENMAIALAGNEIISQIDFFAPLKKDKEWPLKKLEQRMTDNFSDKKYN